MRIEAPPEKILRLHELQRLRAEASRRKLGRYYDDPVGFARNCVKWPDGEFLTSYQADILGALHDHKKVSARGPHGLGKTTYSALAVLWFALTRDAARVDWKCPTTAGAWRQLEYYLWPEIHKWARRIRWDVLKRDPFKPTELLSLNLKLRYGAAFAVASDIPALIEGVHGDSVLYVFDESKAIKAATFDAAEGAFSADTGTGLPEALAIANSTPGEPSGRFFEIHSRKTGLEDWWVRHVTLEESIAAGRVARGWAEQRARQWGEASALYANRVLGDFHASDESGVIPLAWVEAAVERWHRWAAAKVLPEFSDLGLDVARSGQDRTVMALRHGPVIAELRVTALEDTMQTTGRAVGVLSVDPTRRSVVDVIGIGAGVVDRLRELGYRVEAFNASEGTDRKDRSGELGFINCRSAAWWNMRELLDPAFGAEVALPPDDELVGDLVAPRYVVTSTGKLKVESKDDIRDRIGRSTDHGDAVIQAFWPDTRRSRMVFAGRATAPVRPNPEIVAVA